MNLVNWYHASGLQGAELNVPLLETTIVFVLLTVCLLFRLSRTGLIIAYLFFYRVGWTVLQHVIGSLDASSKTFTSTAYIVFGILVFTFAIIGMIHSSHTEA
jgi:hypothetical protein